MSSSVSNRKRKMKRDGEWRKRNEVITPRWPPVVHEDKFMKLEEYLLPGISNDVTLALIATKLPLGTIHNLPLVSPAWRQATHDRLVYYARALANSGDTFVVISDTYYDPSKPLKPTAISLYSLRHKSLNQLPPIPQVESGFPYDSECIALDGKVYILGGSKDSCSRKSQRLASKDMYVLDLAGQRQWKKCARMQQARANFKCGANEGKIYAFGGTSGKRWVLGSEVYDPNVDAWSAITPMGSGPNPYDTNVTLRATSFLRDSWGLNYSVGTAGELLIVLGRDYSVRGYCPVTGTWRHLFDKSLFAEDEREFTAHGKLHSMSLEKIQVYDSEENEWTDRHSCRYDTVRNPHHLYELISVLAVDNEILALILRRPSVQTGTYSTCLLQSKGFGSENIDISWEELPCSLSFPQTCRSMSVLKL